MKQLKIQLETDPRAYLLPLAIGILSLTYYFSLNPYMFYWGEFFPHLYGTAFPEYDGFIKFFWSSVFIALIVFFVVLLKLVSFERSLKNVLFLSILPLLAVLDAVTTYSFISVAPALRFSERNDVLKAITYYVPNKLFNLLVYWSLIVLLLLAISYVLVGLILGLKRLVWKVIPGTMFFVAMMTYLEIILGTANSFLYLSFEFRMPSYFVRAITIFIPLGVVLYILYLEKQKSMPL